MANCPQPIHYNRPGLNGAIDRGVIWCRYVDAIERLSTTENWATALAVVLVVTVAL